MKNIQINQSAEFIARLFKEGNRGYPRWAKMLSITGLDIEVARKIAGANAPAATTPGRALRRIRRIFAADAEMRLRQAK